MINKINVKGKEYNIGGGSVEITYAELKALRDNSQLAVGTTYIITNYQCTTTQENTQSANHQFDIIVVADSPNTLNENARARIHKGDTYFAECKLEAWELKYCLDNDTTRFAWADEVNGKGVVYWLKDEHNNECPYDFKNIMFTRTISFENGYPELDEENGVEIPVYTFSATSYHTDNDEWSYLKDGSLESPAYHMSDEETKTFCNNIIKPYIEVYDGENEDYTKCGIQYLNNNVFFGYWTEINSSFDDTFYYAYCCFNNTLGIDCHDNTFGYDCNNNTFGYNCYDNTFGEFCSNNTFGNECTDNVLIYSHFNTFGNQCENIKLTGSRNNIFGDQCSSITFGNNCSYNVLYNACWLITFGEYCSNNILERACSIITLGIDCSNNTFGYACSNFTFDDECIINKFGNGCNEITFGTNCTDIEVGNDCFKIQTEDYCYNIKFGNNCEQIRFKANYSNLKLSSNLGQVDFTDDTLIDRNCEIIVDKTNSDDVVAYYFDDPSNIVYYELNNGRWEEID